MVNHGFLTPSALLQDPSRDVEVGGATVQQLANLDDLGKPSEAGELGISASENFSC